MSLTEDGRARPVPLRLIFMDDGWTWSPGGGDLRKTSCCEKSGRFKAWAREGLWTARLNSQSDWFLMTVVLEKCGQPSSPWQRTLNSRSSVIRPSAPSSSLPSWVCRPLYSRAMTDWRSHTGRRRMHPQWKWKDWTSSKQWLEKFCFFSLFS